MEVRPEVAVISPEIVGVAVQAVGLTVKVVPLLPREVEVELVMPSCSAPAESMTVLPLVAVWMVRLPAVLVQEEVPPEAMTTAPVELPRLTVLPAVPAKVALPETLIPPVPWIWPEPELRPTNVPSPAWVTEKLAPEISFPLPELVMAMTSPVAEALDWVTPRTMPESVPPVEVLFEVIWKAVALSVLVLVVTVRLNRTSAALSLAVKVPFLVIWRSLIPEAAPKESRVRIVAPVPFGFKVRAPLAPVATVKAPESAMLLVVKVWLPMTVPVIKVPTPALEMRVVPPRVRAPAVMATLPAVAVMSPVVAVIPAEPVNRPAEVMVPEEVVEMLPVVDKVPLVLTVNWPEEPTDNSEPGVELPMPTLPFGTSKA